MSTSDERRDEELLYHKMTLKELQERAPFIDWRGHFEDALRIVKRKITEKEQVVVYAPDYLEKLTKIIATYNATVDGKMCVKLIANCSEIDEFDSICLQCVEQLFGLANG